MADKKISALTSASTPLAGTEVFPLVQGGSTVKTPVNSVINSNLTASFGAVTATVSGVPAITAIRDLDVGVVGDAGQLIAMGARNGATPIAGTDILGTLEVGGVTGRFAVRTLTSGTMTNKLTVSSAGDVTANLGNFVLGTAGKGIDFSANGGDVLTQYDEGTWTPLDYSGAGLTLTAAGSYTRIGRVVYFSAEIIYPATANSAWAAINGLPFVRSAGAVGGAVSLLAGAGKGYTFPLLSGANGGYLYKIDDQGTHALNSDLSGQTIQISGSYTV
jgi:hypothetical protein